jgi:hypothetical protein
MLKQKIVPPAITGGIVKKIIPEMFQWTGPNFYATLPDTVKKRTSVSFFNYSAMPLKISNRHGLSTLSHPLFGQDMKLKNSLVIVESYTITKQALAEELERLRLMYRSIPTPRSVAIYLEVANNSLMSAPHGGEVNFAIASKVSQDQVNPLTGQLYLTTLDLMVSNPSEAKAHPFVDLVSVDAEFEQVGLATSSLVMAIDLIDNNCTLQKKFVRLPGVGTHVVYPRRDIRSASGLFVTVITPDIDIDSQYIMADANGVVSHKFVKEERPLDKIHEMGLYSTIEEANSNGDAAKLLELELSRLKNEVTRLKAEADAEAARIKLEAIQQQHKYETEALRQKQVHDRLKHEYEEEQFRQQQERDRLKAEAEKLKYEYEKASQEREHDRDKEKHQHEREKQHHDRVKGEYEWIKETIKLAAAVITMLGTIYVVFNKK